MGNAIKHTGNQTSNASQLADMLSRMASGKQGDESGSESFARLMSQHQGAQPGNLASLQAAQASRPTTLTTPNKPVGANALSGLAGARMQAARASTPSASIEPERAASTQASRQEARLAKSRSEQAPKQAPRPPSSSQAKPANEAADARRSDGTERTEARDGADEATRFTTAMGEGSAEVRELTPPADVQANDAASMMAWLVSLTQAGGASPVSAEGSVDGDASGEGLALEGESGLTLGQDAGKDDKGRGRGLAAGWGLGQRDLGLDTRAAAASSAAALQVDALLGRGAAAAGQDGDPLSAMMSLEGGRASFGHTLSQVTAPRHEQASIPVPLDAPDFSQKLADQVSLWVGQVKQDGPMTAELHLNPAEMGPINVKISLDGTAAQVDFAAAAQETRQAIEASLSALSTALNDVGLSLSGGGVSSQTPQQSLAQGGNSGQDGRGGRSPDGRPLGDDADALEAGGLRQVSAPKASRLGGLDLYA